MTRDELIRELEHEMVHHAQPGSDTSINSQEEDWSRTAELAIGRLRSGAVTEEDEKAARDVLDKIRKGFLAKDSPPTPSVDA